MFWRFSLEHIARASTVGQGSVLTSDASSQQSLEADILCADRKTTQPREWWSPSQYLEVVITKRCWHNRERRTGYVAFCSVNGRFVSKMMAASSKPCGKSGKQT